MNPQERNSCTHCVALDLSCEKKKNDLAAPQTCPHALNALVRVCSWRFLVVFAAGASFVLVWHMSAQLKRQAVQDLETVEGLLYFGGDGQLHFNEEYHNPPESKLVQDRLLEVLSLDGTILYRTDRIGTRTIAAAPFTG